MSNFYVENNHEVTVSNLRYDDGTVITDANVEMTLYHRDKTTEVSGAQWPIAMSHQSSGTYTGSLPHDVNVTMVDSLIFLKVKVATTGNEHATWYEKLNVSLR